MPVPRTGKVKTAEGLLIRMRADETPQTRGKSRARCIAVAAWVACMLADSHRVSAQGGPPLVTDDPDTPANGHWEINLASIGSHTRQRWDIAAFDADINYGYGDHVQLKLDVPWMYVRQNGYPAREGLGAANIGLKWRFIDMDDAHRFALSTYPQMLSTWSRYSRRKDIAPSDKAYYLPIEAATAIGGFGLAMEAGRNFVQRQPDEWQLGVATAHACGNDGIECLVELHRTWARHDSQTLFNMGLRYRLGSTMTLLASAGREFGPSSGSQQRFAYYFGLQLTR
jgi:hypothetical protein